MGTKTYPPKIGGIETHVYEIAPRLAAKGHEVSVIAGQKYNKKYEKINGVKVYRVPFLEHHLTTTPTMVPFIIAKARKLDADIYHIHRDLVELPATLFLNPIVFTVHGFGHRRWDRPLPVRQLARYCETTAIRFATKVISVDYLTGDYVKKIHNDSIVIPNGFSFDKYYNMMSTPPSEFIDDNKIKILFVGRFLPSKGAGLLIKAFKGLPEQIKNHCTLYIIGDGPQRNEIISLASKEERIKVLGYVNDVIPYFQHSDIFVLPSFYEGLPIALLEALALGNACLATRIGDIPKRFTHNRELLLVAPGDVIDLRSKLIDLINDEKKRKFLAKNAMKVIKEEYDWERIVDQIENIYEKALIASSKSFRRRRLTYGERT